MSAAPDLSLLLRGLYRGSSGGEPDRARHFLASASDALSLALLTLAGDGQGSQGQKRARAEAARGFLVEAVTALSRARIYDSRVRTHAVPFVMATESNLESELARLHAIATRLLWTNHAYLPAKAQAEPLNADEEAQLADVLASLRRSARIGRVSRYRWSGAAVVAGAVGVTLGLPLFGGALAASGLLLGSWIALRSGRRPRLALGEAG